MTIQRNLDEVILIQRIAEQDSKALSELYDRYARVLYAVAFKMLNVVEETEEVVLDVFNQVWRTAERYDTKKARVDTWLFMQTRSRALDKLRARQRMAKTAIVSVDAGDMEELVSPDNPEEDVVIKERQTIVIAAMKQLSPEQQQVLQLAYYSGLTHAEIAAQTGLALGTVKTRIRLGLNKLRNVLELLIVDF
ncbi:MAG: sigma-70 family RNA polymerase sigma factor [Scytonematopsis contorta HA4267-MV1]|jgi:RNA polymerase sigma-70 factor (ECF subfamily)|nr:sigma-70 family RNA polymerase sigma factor [Scytonematopsis contorta HA4267-MV1]